MVRLSRAQQQEQTRAAVLAAARTEFSERGYAEAKVDRIAERAELTRGAVYSNFPSKRALYLAVLVDQVDRVEPGAGDEEPPPAPPSMAAALGAFARAWLHQLPLTDDVPAFRRVRLGELGGVVDDEPALGALAQVTRLEALLLALALESRLPAGAARERQVRRAELVLRLLNGPGPLAGSALGSGDPFDVAHACEHLAGLQLADSWDPPHLPYVRSARACQDPWTPPEELPELLTGRRVGFAEDGVIAVLGTSRLGAAEEIVRAARPGDRVTVAVVTSDPAETGRLVQLRIGDFAHCLRRAFAPDAWPRLHLVLDDRARLAAAVGVPDADDATEYAVRVQGGDIVARARGRGAGHAAAAPAGRATPTPMPRETAP
ncbi:AcrR family transcriptional regulator [Kitasatospora sp. MAP12-15]|uniref:helix-turn-helix domain-containing protein n=1 Tax=unclassified Kitasatospora TaxID=2633591 RepID=UPI002473CD88|nr:helix-turn-helix domain-containing protein [Kitasatospora sp. MAP12-44]MDH6115190.1 AcrR family transcriptional regulator [Kitasatospora sp. MAP12-44]